MLAWAGVAAQGDDRRVLDEEQHVAHAILLAELNQSLLQAQGGCVIAAAEIEDGDYHALTRILGSRLRSFRFQRRWDTPGSAHEPVSWEAAGR